MLRKTLLILTAALGLTMSAHARLGWTLEQCQDQWGAPSSVKYNSEFDLTAYNFKARSNLFAQIYLLNGHVHCVTYCSKNAQFLAYNAKELLAKNYSGPWEVYDDTRGKKTIKSWKATDENGQIFAYALLWADTDENGFYHLQVSTLTWSTFLGAHDVEHAPNSNGLNI